MANERFPAARGYLYAKRESTYGTDASPGASDWVPLTSMGPHVDHTADSEQLVGMTPGRNGYGSVPTKEHVPVSGIATYLRHPDITAGDLTDVPPEDPLLVACGAQHTADATDATHTYVWDTGNQVGVTIHDTMGSSAGTPSNRGKATGCRLTGELAIVSGMPVALRNVQGFGLPPSTTTDTITEVADSIPSLTHNLPVVMGKGGTFLFVDLDDSNRVYGGGTPASPSNALTFFSWIVDLAMNPQEIDGLGGNGGVHAVHHGVEASIQTSRLLTEWAPMDDFDCKKMMVALEGHRLYCQYTTTYVDSAGSTHQTRFIAYVKVRAINTSGVQQAVRTWEWELEHISPADATDNSPAPGEDNTQVFNAGTNHGLLADPTTTTGLRGTFAIQHQTS